MALEKLVMTTPQTYVIHGPGGQRRYVQTDNPMDAMYRVGSAIINSELTTRPAFREMIDTIRWEDVR